MSEVPLSPMNSQVDQSGASEAVSAGTMLRQAREAAGLHVAALAVSMKVPVKKLEALEADRLDLLPDAVFVRALASSVCRALKMDPTPILLRLPQTTIPRLDTEERGINEPFHSSGHESQLSMPAFLNRPAVWVVGVLLAGAAALMAFPEAQRLEKDADTATLSGSSVITPPPKVITTEPGEGKPAVSAVDTSPMPTPLSQPTTPIVTDVVPASVKSASAAAANPAAVAASVASPVTAAVPSTVAAKPAPDVNTVPGPKVDTSAPAVNLAGSANGTVVFKASGTSWVEVTDAKGVVQLRKTMATGETNAASGALPLAVVIGRADVTQVEVRGKSFSLVGIAKDNVARFEVK